MIIGIGTDILEIQRLQDAIERNEQFLCRILTPEERMYGENRGAAALFYYAGRWAAKEAVSKMLGTGIGKDCSWQDISVRNHPSGEPEVILTGKALEKAGKMGIRKIFLSISHEKHYCVATVIGCAG